MDFFSNEASSGRKAIGKGLPFAPSVFIKANEPTCRTLLFKVMKLTSLMLLAACLSVYANGDAQQRIAISVKNVPLQKLFAEIEKKTTYTFFYDVTILKDAKPVTIEMKDVSVEDILKIALANQNQLVFSITDKTIFVKKELKAVVEGPPADSGARYKLHWPMLLLLAVACCSWNATVTSSAGSDHPQMCTGVSRCRTM